MTITDLPSALRPREKLLARGAASLGNAEWLALLLRTGVEGTGMLQPAERLLQALDNYLRLHLGQRVHEVFAVLFLDAQNQLLKIEEMLRCSAPR